MNLCTLSQVNTTLLRVVITRIKDLLLIIVIFQTDEF